MCGIAGIVSKHASGQRIQQAIHCLRHRGPESEGTWQTDGVVLGHRRLSIVDLSEAAAQPMHFANRYTIVHNGEIYNYLELQKELRQKGYAFSSASDTEVILAAYDAWGNDCLQRFDGMFAFAIWDEREKKLFAARDRFGEKPFFFFYDEKEFVFASEIKSLWSMGVSREINSRMLYNFLTIGYTSNPGDPEESFFNQVHKLGAACFLNFSPSDHRLQVEKYWQIYPEADHSISADAAQQRFVELFSDSIRKRLRTDVPVGTSLSGGLDSSALVAFCHGIGAKHYSHRCFTASFPGFDRDETAYAREVAGQYQLDHRIVTISEEEVVPLMQRVMQHQEEPFGSASVLAQFKVYEAARQNGITVLLDGQGADELLAGYHKYYKWYWQELFRAGKLRQSAELEAAHELGVRDSFSLKEKMATLFPDLAAALQQSRRTRKAFHQADLNRDFAFANKRNLYYSLPASFDLNGALYFNSFVNGLEELLRLADRNSMAHGAEIRLPFLSHQLAEFLFTLPPGLKIRNGWTKWLLRKVVDGKLPAGIVWRKDKTGFEPPQKKWMENAAVREAIMEGKKKLVEHGILSPSAAKTTKPHDSYAASGNDWKYWSASYLL